MSVGSVELAVVFIASFEENSLVKVRTLWLCDKSRGIYLELLALGFEEGLLSLFFFKGFRVEFEFSHRNPSQQLRPQLTN